MINKSGRRTKADKEFDEFGQDTPREREYTEQELYDFHKKIQKFYEPHQTSKGEVMILNHEKLHTAYGACREIFQGVDKEGKQVPHYLYNEDGIRMAQFRNLWIQYEDWRRKKDWGETKRQEELVKTAEEIDF